MSVIKSNTLIQLGLWTNVDHSSRIRVVAGFDERPLRAGNYNLADKQ